MKPEWSKFIEKDGRDFTFLEVIHNRTLRVTQPQVRNMIREELALVKQNGGWKPRWKKDDLAFFTLQMGENFSFANLI